MQVKTQLLALAVLLAGTLAVSAESRQLPKHDAFIVSRDHHHVFRGSHRLYEKMSDGLVEVAYCGRQFWVRYATVAWTELEVEKNYSLSVELNWGKGWRQVCRNPAEQVTLESLGIFEDPKIVAQNDGPTTDNVNRFAAIRDAFRAVTGDTAAKSFHGK